MRNEAEIRALRSEGEQYAAAGMVDRAKLVNAELAARGADPIALPKAAAPGNTAAASRQKRTSTQASTRQKRGA